MRNRILATVLLAACGGGGGGGDDIDGSNGVDAVAGVVPDPGAGAIPFSWPDTEPNDTPAQAVPVGTSVNNGEATWFDGTAASGSLGGAADAHDYFVFKSSPQGGNFHNNPCWDGAAAPDVMDFFVYQVDGGQVGAMVAASTDTDPACENITAANDFTMDPSTVYLLELRGKGSANVIYGA